MAPGRGSSEGGPIEPTERFLTDRLDIAPGVWIAPGAVIVGEVHIESGASIWYGCVLRGDLEPIHVGAGSNLQDLTVVHVDHGQPVRIGARVTIGHRAVVHGCVIEDDALVGMGAVLLSGCRVGRGALVAAGAVVREGFEVPEGRVAAGVPATLHGGVSDVLRERMAEGARTYVRSAAEYLAGRLGGGPHGRGSGRDA